jgi:hypothetical protein
MAAATTVATTDTRELRTVARPKRSGGSVRTRITLAVGLLVALALTGSGAIVYLIGARPATGSRGDEVDHRPTVNA